MKAATTLALFAMLGTAPLAAQTPIAFSSSAFKDGGRMSDRHAGAPVAGPNCFGQNIAPALTWSNLPAGTKSLAIIVYDPDGRSGLGVPHFVAYGIKPDVTGFAEHELSSASPKFIGGKNARGNGVYAGPCPPPGSGDHHYIFTLIATDLEPGALAPGLTRDELFEKLGGGHAKGSASIVGITRHP